MIDLRPSEKAPRMVRGASDPPILWHPCGAGSGADGQKPLLGPKLDAGIFVNEYKAQSMELAGFELATSSLRKMWSKPSDQAF
jgi:hypothetical protein